MTEIDEKSWKDWALENAYQWAIARYSLFVEAKTLEKADVLVLEWTCHKLSVVVDD
jgi:hypothetical protein